MGAEAVIADFKTGVGYQSKAKRTYRFTGGLSFHNFLT